MKINKLIDQAYKIALNDLQSDYGNDGIYAGPRNHHEYWARDSFFASLGSLSINDLNIVKKNLDLFIKYQSTDGEIPLRVEEGSHPLALFGIRYLWKNKIAKFRSSQPWSTNAIDPTALFVITAFSYVKESRNFQWKEKNMDAIKNAGKWLISKIDNNNLIREGFVGNWADMVFKNGNVLYTNVISWKAIDLISEEYKDEDSSYFDNLSNLLKKNILDKFYDNEKGYLIDWIGKSGFIFRDFSPDGNLLAIMYGLIDKKKSKEIINYIIKSKIDSFSISESIDVVWWQRLLTSIFFGPYNLKNKFTWWECYLAVTKIMLGMTESAKTDLEDLGKLIVKHKTVYEILTPDGNPVRYLVYKSEKAIAWTSGMYVYAVNMLKGV